MDVKFVTVRASNVNSVPVVDGQIVVLEDSNGFFYDMNSSRYEVSRIRVSSEVSGVGKDGEVLVVSTGEDAGVYFWDDSESAYVLVANKDTDTYLSVVKNVDSVKSYLVSHSGDPDSKDLLWNDNIYVDLKNGSITAVEFKGVAEKAKLADNATQAEQAKLADKASVSDKVGTETVGSEYQGVYILNGSPTVVKHTVKVDVPEDAKFTDTTYDVFTGSTESEPGTEGLVPAPSTAESDKFLKGDGTWSDVEFDDMVGCTSTEDGKRGFVPAPAKGKYNSFLKGDGSWASYSAGYGLDLVSLTFNLEDSGVAPGEYGPVPNAEEMTTYVGDYIQVPHISVDKYGRITNIYEVPCYVGGGGGTGPEPEATLMTFSQTVDGSNLLCTYQDLSTAACEFSIENDNLMCEYKKDPSPITVHIDENGHAVATLEE